MPRLALFAVPFTACTLFLTGCVDSGGGPPVTLVPATGVVTYQGGPVNGATVMFVPEKGPVASGVTNLEGKFTLNSGSSKGVAVGPAAVAITSLQGGSTAPSMAPGLTMADKPATPEEGQKKMEAMLKAQKDRASGATAGEKPKSLIPEKYGTAKTSGLKVEVTTDASKNTFTFDLK